MKSKLFPTQCPDSGKAITPIVRGASHDIDIYVSYPFIYKKILYVHCLTFCGHCCFLVAVVDAVAVSVLWCAQLPLNCAEC